MKFNGNSPQKAAMVYLILGMLPSGIKIFLLPVYINFLSPADYGILSILNVFAAAYGILGAFQMNIGVGVHFFKTEAKDAFEKTAISSTIILAFISFLFFMALGPVLFKYFFKIPELDFFPLGLMTLVTGLVTQVHLVYFVLLKNTYRLKELSIYSVSLLVLSSGLQFFLIVFMELNVMGSVLGGLIANAGVVVVLLFLNRKSLTFHVNYDILKGCLAVSLPMIPSVFINWVINFGDRVILEKYLTLHDLGIYTLLLNILGVSLLISQSLATAIRPMFFTYLNDPQENKSQLMGLDRNFTLISVLSSSAVMLIGFNLELIISDERYLSIIPFMSMAIFILLPKALVKLPRLAMAFKGKTGLISLFTFVNAAVMITLMLWLIPIGGITYALISMSIASAVELLLCYIIFYQLKIPNSAKASIIMVLASSILITGVCWIGLKMDWAYGIIGILQFMVALMIIVLIERKNLSISRITNMFNS
ncbi:MAG: lipopolysaccharide biosynthesis protein [Cytophagales bacterium]|nr:lipopolysaccharide biosynthesis protein [Cytophagales bacterium]